MWKKLTARYRAPFLTLMVCAVLGFTAPAGAQLPSSTQSGSDARTDIPLAEFTQAYRRVETLRRAYLPAIDEAATQAERTRILHQAHNEMRAAIEQEGLTVEQYSRASLAIRQHPELRAEVVRRLGEAQQ